MAYTSRPDHYLDPPNWNHQQHAHQIQLVQHCSQDGGNGFAVGGSSGGEAHQLLQSVPPPRVDGSMAGMVRPGSMADRARLAKIPTPEHALKCPRCESTNTKFCYFNNYSLSQPRHFCKTCRRYWTRGGALRNVPVGGGCRRNKRSKSSGSKSSNHDAKSGSSSGSMTRIGASGAMNSSLIPPSQLPLLASLHPLPDYGAMNIGLNYGGIQSMDPVDYPGGGGNETVMGLEHWRPLQQFPCFLGLDSTAPPRPSLGVYPFNMEGGDTGASTASSLIPGQVQGRMTCAGLITQLASVKMEENNAQSLNLPRQYLGIANDHYWSGTGSANGGGGGTGAGILVGTSGAVWTDLSAINSASAGSLL